MSGSKILFGVAALVGLWLVWGLVDRASGDRLHSQDTPTGDWVGEMVITGGYDPAQYGNTAGPHTHAVVRGRLDLEDASKKEYQGVGELMIIGESKPRALHMGLQLNDGQPGRPQAEGYVLTNPIIAGQLSHCEFQPDTIVMHSTSGNDLRFTLTMHRGDAAEYHRLVNQLTAAAQGGQAHPGSGE